MDNQKSNTIESGGDGTNSSPVSCSKPMVTQRGILDMQVCVPKEWTDTEVKEFADMVNMCGTTNGWAIRKEGASALNGAPERVQCSEREDCVHIMLDA